MRTHFAMPNPSDRLPYNQPGPFYVDSTCIDCDQCRATAPEFFRRNDDEGLSYVHSQPRTPEDLALAQEALESCPSDSIGCEPTQNIGTKPEPADG